MCYDEGSAVEEQRVMQIIPRQAQGDSPGPQCQPAAGISGSLLMSLALLAACLVGCTASRCSGVEAFGNLGEQINSPYDDYAAVLQDTSTLIFTSNRPRPGAGGLQEQFLRVRPTDLLVSMRLLAELGPGAVLSTGDSSRRRRRCDNNIRSTRRSLQHNSLHLRLQPERCHRRM